MDFNFILFISNYVLPDQNSWFYAICKSQCAVMTGYRGHQSFFYHPDTMACLTLPDKIYFRRDLRYNAGYQYWMNNVEFCKSNPCNAGDTCVDVTGGFECQCMNILKDNISVITSPKYPTSYDPYVYNCYLIIGRPGQNISLNLDAQYNIETDGTCDGPLTTGALSCKFDYLELQGVRYCGGVPPEPMVIPTGANTTVRFKTDSGHACIGYKLSITYTNDLKKPGSRWDCLELNYRVLSPKKQNILREERASKREQEKLEEEKAKRAFDLQFEKEKCLKEKEKLEHVLLVERERTEQIKSRLFR